MAALTKDEYQGGPKIQKVEQKSRHDACFWGLSARGKPLIQRFLISLATLNADEVT